jgi:hypothetical protein
LIMHYGLLIYIVLFLAPNMLKAQRDTAGLVLTVGDSITLQPCSNAEYGYLSIDIVVKTRWVDRGLSYDTITGAGFYYYFFNEGDFDSKRLPCDYKGQKFRIAGFQTIKNEEGTDRLIVFGQINNDPKTALWVDMEQAIALKEVSFNH